MEEEFESPDPTPPVEEVAKPSKAKFNRRAALVLDSAVINVIVVEEDEDGVVEFELPGHEIVVLPDDSQVTFGWIYFEGQFFPPPPVEAEPEELPLSE